MTGSFECAAQHHSTRERSEPNDLGLCDVNRRASQNVERRDRRRAASRKVVARNTGALLGLVRSRGIAAQPLVDTLAHVGDVQAQVVELFHVAQRHVGFADLVV